MTDATPVPTLITFTGEPDPELEKVLAGNFVSWNKDEHTLAIKFDDGFALDVVKGDRVERQADGSLVVWH